MLLKAAVKAYTFLAPARHVNIVKATAPLHFAYSIRVFALRRKITRSTRRVSRLALYCSNCLRLEIASRVRISLRGQRQYLNLWASAKEYIQFPWRLSLENLQLRICLIPSFSLYLTLFVRCRTHALGRNVSRCVHPVSTLNLGRPQGSYVFDQSSMGSVHGHFCYSCTRKRKHRLVSRLSIAVHSFLVFTVSRWSRKSGALH